MSKRPAVLGGGTYWSATSGELQRSQMAFRVYDDEEHKADMTADERHADTVGKDFADNYFGEMTIWEGFLERYCDDESRYVHVRRRRRRMLDLNVHGVAEIVKFATRVEINKFKIEILSVDTMKYREPNWYTALTVCNMTRAGTENPRKFFQSTVFKYAPLTTRKFTIVCAVLKFEDGYGFAH